MNNFTSPSVYVGTYHKYNCGSIAGQWLDLDDYSDEDDFYEACRALHVDEADPEFMFQDYEGIPGRFASESSIDWDFIDGYKEASKNQQQAAYVEWTDHSGRTDYSEFEDAYIGEADSEEDYAYEYVQDNGLLDSMPESLKSYFDYESFGRDLFLNGLTWCNGFVFSR
ncbi:antirestriction ArdA family protein [Pectobacterium atrosepticum ICMP 1526]|uniref:antirestriction protein ArdA n=1 Tax=Pectobacterium atrosepticum TaxID=29471 RepID=UPI000500BCB1|nr:antirestriction protein ArdA [Pectobacterium atrosepticum]KFX10485.1 antirestriction protein [Pectobacterium atrosepticum]KMK87568.1 antirestriction ArdA family protein [Pectobacterium atrosepticum ICMP 1526]QXE13025.1 antirestriction protein ArdA [Pectobacterium atrosepticum]